MKRIAFFVHHYPPDPTGGTERHVEGLARGLTGRGWDVTVVTGTMRGHAQLDRVDEVRDGVRVVRIHRDDYHFERWHRGHHAGTSRLVGEILDELRPDVVHVHHWLRLTDDLVQVARRRAVPTVLTLHDYYATCPRITRILPTGALCRAVAGPIQCRACLGPEYPDWDGLSADSLALRSKSLAAELRAAQRILVLSRTQGDVLTTVEPQIELRVQPFAPSEPLRRSPPPESDRPLQVATLGRINAEKGHHILLEAVRGLPQPRGVRVHLFGEVDDATYGQRLTTLAHGLDVVWHGRYDNAQLERAPLHLIALTSTLFETYGLVLDEARALGVPVLASNTGAYPERVGDGGLLFPCGDVDALRALLQRCVDEPSLVPTLRRGVASPPSFAMLLDYLERCYAEVISDAKPTAPGLCVSDHDRLVHEAHRGDRLERLLNQAHDELKQLRTGSGASPASPGTSCGRGATRPDA